MLLESARTITQKKLAAAALTALLSAGALTAAGEVAQAQSGEGEVVNREVVVNEDRDYTGLWGLLGLLGLAGLAGLRRKKDDNVDVRRSPSAERSSGARNVAASDGSSAGNSDSVQRGTVRDSEVVRSTEDGSVDGDKVNVRRKG